MQYKRESNYFEDSHSLEYLTQALYRKSETEADERISQKKAKNVFIHSNKFKEVDALLNLHTAFICFGVVTLNARH